MKQSLRIQSGRPVATATVLFAILLLMKSLGAGSADRQIPPEKKPEKITVHAEDQLRKFFAAKAKQAHQLAAQQTNETSSEVWDFFNAGLRRDWAKAERISSALSRRAYQYEGVTKPDPGLMSPVWQTVIECLGAQEQFTKMDKTYLERFSRDIIESIPRGAVYFGGTDPGRFIITAMCRAHIDGDPFFTITQNALADGNYLAYLRAMYGKPLHMLSEEDSRKAFEEYLADARKRMEKGQLKPGEDVRMVEDRITVAGQVAVMQINGILTRMIFDRNADKEFFAEESFPLDWMYPHLTPHGLILKINRKPLEQIPAEAVDKDRKYWTNFAARAIGPWLTEKTSIEDLRAWCERVFQKRDFQDFKGDPAYIQNDYAHKTFSKCRCAMAGVYQWRAEQAANPGEKERMLQEANFAYRQALALCPYSPEAVFRFVNHLVARKRLGEAWQIADLAARMEPANAQFKAQFQDLARQLNAMKE